MLSKIILAAVALQAGLATAGNAIVSNRCSYDIYLWSVGGGSSSNAIHVPARSQYTEPFQNTPKALKICTTDSCTQPTQFEYSIVNNQLWYDISFVDCASGQDASKCPGHAEGLAMSSSHSACPNIDCSAGSYCPSQAYYVDQPLIKLGIQEPVYTCQGAGTDMDLSMTVCSGETPLKRSIAGRVAIDLEG
jgi:hypothetical protein